MDLGSDNSAQAAVRELLEGEAPTALFTGQNLITIGALRTLRDLGLSSQVALVGFDDLPLADMISPGITVIAQDPQAIGVTACQALFQRMEGDHSPPQHYTIPTRLIERGSGEIPPPA
jgi:LacI family transcriptional regulator